MRLFVGAVLALFLSGCLDQGKPDGLAKATKDVESIEVTSNSPDAAVKSWWAVKDAGIRLDLELCAEYTKSTAPVNDKLRSLASDAFPFRERCSVAHAYERKIVKVEVESETRAVVNALNKNVEPRSPGPNTMMMTVRQRNQAKNIATRLSGRNHQMDGEYRR